MQASSNDSPSPSIPAASSPSDSSAAADSPPISSPPVSSLPVSSPAADDAAPTTASASGGHEAHAAAHPAGHGHDHDHPEPIQRLRKLLQQESSALWVVLVYAVFIGLLTLATPVAVQALVNQVTFGQLRQPLLVLTLLLFFVLLFSGGLRLLQTAAVEQLQQRLFVRLGSELSQLLPHVLTAHWSKPPGVRLVSRFFEIITVQKSLSSLLLDGLALLLQSLIGLLVLGFYHPLLLGFDVLLLLAIAGIVLGLGRGAIKTAVLESRAKYQVADWLMELGTHSLTLRGAHGSSWAVSRADDLLVRYVLARRQNFAILRRQIVGALLLQALASAMLLGLGGMLVILGQLTLGQLVAAELIVSMVVSGVLKFTKHMESYYDLLAGLDKLGYLHDLQSERHDGESLLLPDRPEVLLHNVHVHDPNSKSELHIDTLHLQAGERGAIIGDVDKRLLSELLYGILSADSGRVEVGGIPVRSLSLSSLRQQVALLHDDAASIVAGTIADNLRFAKPDVSLLQMRDALITASLWDEVSTLPLGLDTPLLSGAPGWSPIMRWRLVLARLLVQKPKLVLIDGLHDTEWELLPLLSADAPWTLLWISEAGHPLLHHCTSVYSVDHKHLHKTTSSSAAREVAR
jgi:putative ABC transport system ATP-binding protein